MPLFAGYAIQNRIKETLALEDKARTDLEAARRTVSQATRAAYFGVLSGQGQAKALEAAEASSQSALDANKLGYQVGVRINIDVLNAQSQLYQTKRDLAKARYDVLVGGLRLRQANGSLTANDLQGDRGDTGQVGRPDRRPADPTRVGTGPRSSDPSWHRVRHRWRIHTPCKPSTCCASNGAASTDRNTSTGCTPWCGATCTGRSASSACATTAEGIDAGIDVRPIPPVGFAPFDNREPWSFGHGWLKLTSFADPLYDLQGPTLFLDLDIVIVDNIDCFFDHPGTFCVIREWDKQDGTGNTSVYRYTIGAHADALAHLKNGYPGLDRRRAQRAGIHHPVPRPPGQGALLAPGLVRQLQAPLRAARPDELVQAADHPGRREDHRLPRQTQPARCHRRRQRQVVPPGAANRLGGRALALKDTTEALVRATARVRIKAEIARPYIGEVVPTATAYRMHGAAWTGNAHIVAVDISDDAGATWHAAKLLGSFVPNAWQLWEHAWQTPAQPGTRRLMARATDSRGHAQPSQHDADCGSYLVNHCLPIEIEVR